MITVDWAEFRIPKTCSRCGETKTWGDFPGDCTTPTGRSYTCRSCKNAAARARYHQDIEWSRRINRDEYHRNGKIRRLGKKRWQAWIDQLARENGWVKEQPTKGDTRCA